MRIVKGPGRAYSRGSSGAFERFGIFEMDLDLDLDLGGKGVE